MAVRSSHCLICDTVYWAFHSGTSCVSVEYVQFLACISDVFIFGDVNCTTPQKKTETTKVSNPMTAPKKHGTFLDEHYEEQLQ